MKKRKRKLLVLASIIVVFVTVFVWKSKRPNQAPTPCQSYEAQAILSEVRFRQNAFRATFHEYLDLSPAGWIPDSKPGSNSRDWPSNETWNRLGVKPTDPVCYSYYCEAGFPEDSKGTLNLFSDVPEVVEASRNDFWYACRAVEDFDGDGLCGGAEVDSGSVRIRMLEEEAALCPTEIQNRRK